MGAADRGFGLGFLAFGPALRLLSVPRSLGQLRLEETEQGRKKKEALSLSLSQTLLGSGRLLKSFFKPSLPSSTRKAPERTTPEPRSTVMETFSFK